MSQVKLYQMLDEEAWRDLVACRLHLHVLDSGAVTVKNPRTGTIGLGSSVRLAYEDLLEREA